MKNNLERLESLRSRLSEKTAGCRLVYEPETGSTNDLALEAASNGAKPPCVFLADVQTRGRGRFDRVWESRADSSLTFSLLLRPDCPVSAFPMLTEVYGLAVCKTIREMSGAPALIKWPNDVVIQGRKVCGILTVASADLKDVVIGVGINVKRAEFSDELKEKAISLEEACGKQIDKDELLIRVNEEFFHLYDRFRIRGDMGMLKEEYRPLLVNIGKQVRITEKDRVYQGTALDIDETGRLLFRLESGEVRALESGEVSVSGIYGEKW